MPFERVLPSPTTVENDAINAIGERWANWLGYPRPITNAWGAAAEAVDALKAEPALLRRLLAEAESEHSDEGQ